MGGGREKVRERGREGGSVGDDEEEERGRERRERKGSLGGREREKREEDF